MNADGRSGHGVMKKGQPASTILFSFAEGKPMHVTDTIPPKPNTAMLFSFSSGEDPRYACLGGVDSFGRTVEGRFGAYSGSHTCGSAFAY